MIGCYLEFLYAWVLGFDDGGQLNVRVHTIENGYRKEIVGWELTLFDC